MLRSVDGRRIRKRDSREDAYDMLLKVVSRPLLEDSRLQDEIELHDPTPGGHIGAVVGLTPDSFAILERVLQEAGLSGIRFKRQDGLLDFYLR